MLKLLSTLSLVIIAICSVAQAPAISLEYEEVEIDAIVLPSLEAEAGEGVRTYRVYLRIPEFWELQTIYSDFANALDISSTTSFYQNEFGSATTLGISPGEQSTIPEINYDSWLTIGAENNQNNLLLVAPDESVFSEFENGGNILVNDFVGVAIFVTGEILQEQNTIDENGRILISQFTTNGGVDACYNFQIRRFNEDGTPFDPPGPETSEFYQYTNQCINIPEPQLESLACIFDLDDNGQVSISDLLILLTLYGCNSNCLIDLNGDGDTGFEEVASFLSVFNQTCE
jgi:hypothetical protein